MSQGSGTRGKDLELARLIGNFIRGVRTHHPGVWGISVQILPDCDPPDVETWVEIQAFVGRDQALELFSNALRAEMGEKRRRHAPDTPT